MLCSLLASKRTAQPGGVTGFITGRVGNSTSSSDSKLAECVKYQVKCQHECNNHGVKTLDRQLCSIRARSRTSPHIRAPLPLHCLCHSGRAAVMSCGQQTSIDPQQGCVLRCPGEQAAAVRSRGYTDIGRTPAAAQLHYQGYRSWGNRSCSITQGGTTPRAANSGIPNVIMQHEAYVSAILAGAPRFDCSICILDWLQDCKSLSRAGGDAKAE